MPEAKLIPFTAHSFAWEWAVVAIDYGWFVNAVVRTQSIPFSISTTEETPGERALKAFQHARQSVDRNEPEMTLDEINEEIRLARAERKARLE